jgi:hypothetical protein
MHIYGDTPLHKTEQTTAAGSPRSTTSVKRSLAPTGAYVMQRASTGGALRCQRSHRTGGGSTTGVNSSTTIQSTRIGPKHELQTAGPLPAGL